MPHVALVPFTGLRVCSSKLRELGFTLPGLRRRGAAVAELPALGLLTLAGMLPDDWTCSYHPVSDTQNDEVLERILAERPTVVAISALTASVIEAYQFSTRLRTAGLAVVIGGLHATACPEEAAQFCDAVIVGDGEPCWRSVLHDASTGELRQRYGPTSQSGELSWALPRFDLLGDAPPRFTLQTQRGCPFVCNFCAASRLLGTFREKPLDRIAEELGLIREWGDRPLIELADDNTFAGPRDAHALCNLLGSSGARWFTESDWRIGERPDLLQRMASTGCVQVLVGIESLVFRYPGMGAKRASLERIMAAIAAIQDAGIAVNGCFIVGADGETRASIDRLVRFVLDCDLADVQLTLQTPFPGTTLRRQLDQQGRLLRGRDWSHYTLLDVTFQPDCLTVVELEQAFYRAVEQVYCSTATGRRSTIRRIVWQRNPTFHNIPQP